MSKVSCSAICPTSVTVPVAVVGVIRPLPSPLNSDMTGQDCVVAGNVKDPAVSVPRQVTAPGAVRWAYTVPPSLAASAM